MPRKHWFGKYFVLEEVVAVKNKLEPKIVVSWRPTTGEPSALWRRLWAKLLTDRKTRPASIHEAADDGGCRDAEKRDI